MDSTSDAAHEENVRVAWVDSTGADRLGACPSVVPTPPGWDLYDPDGATVDAIDVDADGRVSPCRCRVPAFSNRSDGAAADTGGGDWVNGWT